MIGCTDICIFIFVRFCYATFGVNILFFIVSDSFPSRYECEKYIKVKKLVIFIVVIIGYLFVIDGWNHEVDNYSSKPLRHLLIFLEAYISHIWVIKSNKFLGVIKDYWDINNKDFKIKVLIDETDHIIIIFP